MNLIVQSLASAQWGYVVKALLHTLWLGALAAGGLYLILRGKTDPATRYRWCVGALVVVVMGGIVAWAMLQGQPAAAHSSGNATPVAAPATILAGGETVSTPMVPAAATPGPSEAAPPGKWTPWLALVWLGGVAAMLARAGSLVAGAEKLRRRSSPLENEAVLKLVEEARQKLKLARRIRVVVTEQLTSPAVMGLVTPVVILPLTMVTTLPMAQLHLILLHELAHIRRGDYLVNLCQLLAESLFFFNPAVWWISRQIRQEREACCDAVAIALAGEPLRYAQTLAQVAGEVLAAAPAFGDRANPSGLKDRVQRLLVPGYRPALRLTWRALLASLFAGGGLLFLSAVGTRVAVAAILSPQERIARIEQKMTELGQPPVAEDGTGVNPNGIMVTFHLRTADGAPLPRNKIVMIRSISAHSTSVGPAWVAADGWATNNRVGAGQILVQAEADGYAPALAGPFDGRLTNHVDAGELILGRGFEVSLHVTDADSGAAVTDAALHAQFVMRFGGQGFQGSQDLRPDAAGRVTLPLCLDQLLLITVNAPGYELIDHRFDRLSAGQTLELKLKSGKSIAGRVVDKATGEGIAGATFRIIHEKKSPGDDTEFQWSDPRRLLAARTDSNGRFTVNQLRHDAQSWLGVGAPGHESVLLDASAVDGKDVTVRLGPELVVRGHVIEGSNGPPKNGGRRLFWNYADVIDGSSWGSFEEASVQVKDGVTTFQFTNHVAGPVTLTSMNGDGYRAEREVTAPIEDWVVDLTRPHQVTEKAVPKREVVFRFKHPSGVPPRGTVSVTVPDVQAKDPRTVHLQEMEITNGEVHAELAIGGRTSVEPKHVAGYWFKSGFVASIEVTNGVGPQVIEIPLVPAGVIYATARNADGTPAGRVLFGVDELKRAPGMDTFPTAGGGDGYSDDSPRNFISGPLPLGGTYQVHAWRGNMVGVSQPVKLTEANPDAEIKLQFPAGKTFEGVVLDPDGKPLRNAEFAASFNLRDNFGIGLNSVFTDEQGRFRMENMTPEAGMYSLEVKAAGALTERVKLNFGSQPQTIQLKRGRTLAGHVVETGTGRFVPNVEVSATDLDHLQLPMARTRTDADGRFEFNTLGDGSYTVFVQGGDLSSGKKFRADDSTNVVLSVKLYEWSQAKAKAAQ
jgi:beta-lactamase regulating signal transducer with metallopeptidase domain